MSGYWVGARLNSFAQGNQAESANWGHISLCSVRFCAKMRLPRLGEHRRRDESVSGQKRVQEDNQLLGIEHFKL